MVACAPSKESDMITYALRSLEKVADGEQERQAQIEQANAEQAAKRKQVAVAEKAQLAFGPVQPLDLNTVAKDDPINGARLLDGLASVLEYYARFPRRADVALTTLWIAGTHWRTIDGNLAFRAWPRWGAIAAPDSGKTRLLELIQALSYSPSDIELSPTEPAVRELITNGDTVLLDELQRVVGRGEAMRKLQAYITGGYKMGAGSSNARGGGINKKPLYGPLAFGALPSLTDNTGHFLDDLVTRVMPLVLMEKSFDTIPDQDNDWDMITTGFSRQLSNWGAEQMPIPTKEVPKPVLWPVHSVPGELSARQRELAKSYFAIADRARDPHVVRETGADTRWARVARQAVLEVTSGQGDTSAEVLSSVESRMAELGIKINEVR